MTKIQELIRTAKNVPSLKSLRINSKSVEQLNTRLENIFSETTQAICQAGQVGEVGSKTSQSEALNRIERLSSPLKKLKGEIESSELHEENIRQLLNQISNSLTKTTADLGESWERSLEGIEAKYRPLVAMAQAASLDKNGELTRSLANISEAKPHSPLSDEKMKKLLSTLTKIVNQFKSLNLSAVINEFLRDIQNEGATLSYLSNNEVQDFLSQHEDLANSLRIKQKNG